MRTPASTLAQPERRSEPRAPLLVVERPQSPLPAWVGAAPVERRAALPGSSVVWCPGVAAQWERAIAEIAAASAAGRVVLVNLPARAPGGSRVVAAVGDAGDDQRVCAEAVRCARSLAGGSVVLVHCVPISFAERSVGLAGAVRRGRGVLRDCLRGLGDRDVPVVARLARNYPHELVGDDLDGTVLVVGGARVGRPGALGLVALSVVRHAPCPVLVVPRPPSDPAPGAQPSPSARRWASE